MGCIIIDDFIKGFCYDNLSLENKIKFLDSWGDSVTLVYKGYTFDEMVEAMKENRTLKREIELLQGQVSYYEDKLEERSYEGEALDDLEKENESLRKENKTLQANIDILKNNNTFRIKEVKERDEALGAIYDIVRDFYCMV